MTKVVSTNMVILTLICPILFFSFERKALCVLNYYEVLIELSTCRLHVSYHVMTDLFERRGTRFEGIFCTHYSLVLYLAVKPITVSFLSKYKKYLS